MLSNRTVLVKLQTAQGRIVEQKIIFLNPDVKNWESRRRKLQDTAFLFTPGGESGWEQSGEYQTWRREDVTVLESGG